MRELRNSTIIDVEEPQKKQKRTYTRQKETAIQQLDDATIIDVEEPVVRQLEDITLKTNNALVNFLNETNNHDLSGIYIIY